MSKVKLNEHENQKNKLITLYDYMNDCDDVKESSKVIDLYEKVSKNEHIIGFTGHFSAGKSSIMNYLLKMNVLPKSPIPTSANIVKISRGSGFVHVYFKDNTIYEYREPYDIDLIQDYCKDKDTIEQVNIHLSNTILPENVALFDTPGIDAADDTDRSITESALHLVDSLYYVMDYHHVQSEVNLQFLQQMASESVPIYIIINQVDKHNDKELSFDHFKEKIQTTFDQWGIEVEAIFYTSTLNFDYPHNEIEKFTSHFFTTINDVNKRYNRTDFAIKHLIEEHKKAMTEQVEKELSELNENQDKVTIENPTETIKKWEGKLNDFKSEFLDEINLTLKNAYLMPASLRDLAENYLQASQADFKVGLFQAKKKTMEERNKRTEIFLTELQKTMDAAIQWKLREKLIEIMQDYNIYEQALIQEAQEISVSYDADVLASFLRQGATLNGQYVLNYTNDLSHDIKNKYRQKTIALWKKIEEYYEPIVKGKLSELYKEKTSYESQRASEKKYESLQKQLKSNLEQLENDLNNKQYTEDTHQRFIEKINQRYQIEEQEAIKTESITKEASVKNIKQKEKIEENSILPREQIIPMLNETMNELSKLSNYEAFIKILQDQKFKLENREVTIALFGAFSAGKSSFANALLGEKILPSSPNPATAVINRITAPDEEHEHGRVKLTYKSAKTLLSDVVNVSNLSLSADLSFIEATKKILMDDRHLEDRYRSFLEAVHKGYDENKTHVGNTVLISIEQFQDIVTDETKACFIEAIDLYYDCPVTRKGLTIVDTPGTDSVNARHTNVAFDYIKHADAILYVTYYNHAVTSADRDFLIQLGRVKDAFTMDKMFFIVNAADLAQSEEDLDLVVNYVDEELIHLGIRQAAIFPVSSKQSLEQKLNQVKLNEQMEEFESKFYSFVENDLVQLTMQTAISEIERIKTNISQTIHAASLEADEVDTYIIQLDNENERSLSVINAESGGLLKERLMERVERQLHFVLERLSIRFHDIFSEYYNPTTVTESGRAAQEELHINGKKLINYIGYELLQEHRAVSLRIEAHLNDLLQQRVIDFTDELAETMPTFRFSAFEAFTFKTPEYEQALVDLSMNHFTKALKVFKNKKSFFEQNEREKMKDLFFELLQPFAKEYVNKHEKLMKDAYEEQLSAKVNMIKEEIIAELNNYVSEQKRVVSAEIDVALLKETHQVITKVLER